MFNKNLLLGCAIATLAACGGQGLDLGPENPNFGDDPVPEEETESTEKTWNFNFEDEAQLASWYTNSEAAGDPESEDCNLEASLGLHWQSSALQIAPTDGWGADFEQLCAFGYVDEPVDMAGGSFYISVYLPSFYTDQNPWNTDADDGAEDDRFNFGLQVVIEDSEGNRGEAAGWVNIYELLGSSFNGEGFGRNQRKDDPVAGDVAGRWFDMRFNAENAIGDANINAIVGMGVSITARDTNPGLAGLDVFGNTKYVFIDNVLMEPNPDYIPPAPTQDPAFLSLPIYTDGTIQSGFGELTGVGGEFELRESIEAAFAGAGSVQIAGPETAIDVSGYPTFRFSVFGPEGSGTTTLNVSLCDCDGASVTVEVEAGDWNDFALAVPEFSDISLGAIKFEYDGTDPLIYYFDNIGFIEEAATVEAGLNPVTNPGLVFYDFNLDEELDDGLDKGAWWGSVTQENDPALSVDGTSYGRFNFQTGSADWQDLFWRNGGSMYGQAVVADNLGEFVLKFDINVMSPIDAGMIRIRFNDADGVDAFYDWAPWADSGSPYSTDGWETIIIPLADLGVPDFSLVDSEFGMAFEGADILLDFAIDNVRFDYPGNKALSEVKNADRVFFDFNLDAELEDGLDKGAWWGSVASENDAALTLDGTSYGRANFQTGSVDWQDLFWRNGSTLYGQAGIADDINDFALKFDINVLSPIDGGMFRIRFNDADGVDAFYDWAPWGTDNPFLTNGWVTVSIPGSDLGVPDLSLVDSEFGMAFEGADILLNFAIDNVRFERVRGAEPVADPELVFYDFNLDEELDDGLDKGAWWGNATPENDVVISLDGTSYGRVNYQTGTADWQDLFWRNGGSMYGQDTVADNLDDYVLRFDLNVLEPINAGTIRMRFNDADGVDAFYDWAPWTDSGSPFSTNGWTTITIPVASLGAPDMSLVDSEFGWAFEGADVLLNFAVDNVRFEYVGE